MTQQSVSKYIAKLEDDIGFRLFIRTHHYVMMTKAGESYYALFSRCDREFEELTERLRREYSDRFNTLRIGYLEWLEISSGIGNALKLIKERRPGLKFYGERHPQFELIEQFYARKLDLIITYAEFAPKGVGIRKLMVLYELCKGLSCTQEKSRRCG